MMRYRWRDRHDDITHRRNPWPLRIEAGIIGGLMIAAMVAGIFNLLH